MKTRLGFVSNSSSSSFCILGVKIDTNAEKIINSNHRTLPSRIRIQYSISHNGSRYVGIEAFRILDDETPRQIKQELVESLQRVGVEIKMTEIDWIEDEGYNG
jgi:hypothetical protein